MATSRNSKRGGGARRPAAKPSRFASVLPFLSGLLLGSVVTYAVMLYTDLPAPVRLAEGDAPKNADPAAGEEDEGIQFSFFNILPEMEVRVFDWELVPEASAPNKPAETPVAEDRYIIQAGSFRSAKEAETLKARLAMGGVRASVQQVVINGQEQWYRVYLGPYADKAELAAMRTRLTRLDIEHIVVRPKASG